MNELVQEFEKTRTFKYFCSTLLKFDESLNCYVATEKWRNKEAELLTAAWWMFQEEHSKIQEMDEVIKLQDADLRKYEKQIESLKTQLAVYKEDMQKDAEKIADLEKYQRVNGECINNLVNQKHDYLHRVTMAIAHLDSFDLSRAGMNKLQRGIESALEALRGAND